MTTETTRENIRALAEAAAGEADARYAEGWDEPDTGAPCALCEREPGTEDALMPDDAGDPQPVRLCAACYEYETGEEVRP